MPGWFVFMLVCWEGGGNATLSLVVQEKWLWLALCVMGEETCFEKQCTFSIDWCSRSIVARKTCYKEPSLSIRV